MHFADEPNKRTGGAIMSKRKDLFEIIDKLKTQHTKYAFAVALGGRAILLVTEDGDCYTRTFPVSKSNHYIEGVVEGYNSALGVTPTDAKRVLRGIQGN
jgi:hypothetical protein